MFLKKIFFVLFSLILFQAHAQERILDFDVKIQIEKSGDIQVVENITINAEGNVFKHGLLRILPLTRSDKDGNPIDVQYTINSVKKNGNTEPYFTKEEAYYWKIYIGDKDTELENGIYKYQISYTVPFQIGFFKDYDELYWNVTGNGWNFPIDKATCQIYLQSENAKFENSNCYTGVAGSKTSDCLSSLNFNSTIVSFKSEKLTQYEGLTVAASFAKGIVTPPIFIKKQNSFYDPKKFFFGSMLFLISMSLFFLFNWRKYGMSPSRKTITPEFFPPYDWSPAVTGYAYHSFTMAPYLSSFINMAVKGAIKICSYEDTMTKTEGYEIEIINEKAKNLSSEESVIFKNLLEVKKIKIENSNYRFFDKMFQEWRSALFFNNVGGNLFDDNNLQKIKGFTVFFSATLIYVLICKNGNGINAAFYCGFSILTYTSMCYWWPKDGQDQLDVVLKCILIFFVFLPAVSLFLMALFYLRILEMGVVGFAFLLYIVYVKNLRRVTERSLEIKERLEGFKLYLQTAEVDKMNMLNPPTLTPQLFEELLPYAIALRLEIEWGKQFETVSKLAKYNPHWYQGDNDPSYLKTNIFLSNFVHSLNHSSIKPSPPNFPKPSKSIHSTSPSSSSSSRSGSSGDWSSGSSGGGRSGGGGGGGGGGGW